MHQEVCRPEAEVAGTMAIMPVMKTEAEKMRINLRKALLIVLALLISCAFVATVFGETKPQVVPEGSQKYKIGLLLPVSIYASDVKSILRKDSVGT